MWGGRRQIDGLLTKNGAVYAPGIDLWRATSADGAPAEREFPSAVWTGAEVIVWGGFTSDGSNTGAIYAPHEDRWRPMSEERQPSLRRFHAVAWTGSEMFVWGGECYAPGAICGSDGAAYNPSTDTWRPIPNPGYLGERDASSAVWDGSSNSLGGRV